MEHRPVLLKEAIQALNIQPDGHYLDGTFGRGGHSMAILELLNQQGRLYACDRDISAKLAADQINNSNFIFYKTAFSKVLELIQPNSLAGILLDLGVSSPQLDDAERGFSFRKNGPLDMRMDTQTGISASNWLAAVEEEELAYVLKEFGEEKFAKRIARCIVSYRLEQAILDTQTLAGIVANAIPKRMHEKHKHPATRTFQAIRIYINNELTELEKFLKLSHNALRRGGRLAIISFHSKEDRLVKSFIHQGSIPKAKTLPWEPEMPEPQWLKIGKPIFPQELEINANPRARSAVLRVGEKL